MRVLLAHNHYQQPGGEDQVFAAEGALLEEHHHQITRYVVHNERVADMSRVRLAMATTWHRATYRELRTVLREARPQVAHFHNTLPLISPAAYYAARAERVPVVQTLHNYRLLCPNALLFRDGHRCEECVGRRVAWPGIAHACYRGSRTASGAVAAMLAIHRVAGTWSSEVDVYVALTEFARQKLMEGGLPAGRIVVKPNFVHPDPGPGGSEESARFALFVGRLVPEKGIAVLLKAWTELQGPLPLKIVGDGPLASEVAAAAARSPRVEWLGRQPRAAVLSLMRAATVLLFPSTWYEGFPLTIIEAFAVGLPVVGSRLGAMSSVIEHGRTGLHFAPDDPAELAAQVDWTLANPARAREMRAEARAEFEAKYTSERNYQQLMAIYEMARSGIGTTAASDAEE